MTRRSRNICWLWIHGRQARRECDIGHAIALRLWTKVDGVKDARDAQES
jgi:hypothetical protein